MKNLRPTALGIVAAGSLSLAGCGNQATRVPKIVGRELRAAERQLFTRHLRWRIAPGSQVFSHLPAANDGSSTDNLPVTGQAPAAGVVAKPNSVVTVVTPCTRKHPCS